MSREEKKNALSSRRSEDMIFDHKRIITKTALVSKITITTTRSYNITVSIYRAFRLPILIINSIRPNSSATCATIILVHTKIFGSIISSHSTIVFSKNKQTRSSKVKRPDNIISNLIPRVIEYIFSSFVFFLEIEKILLNLSIINYVLNIIFFLFSVIFKQCFTSIMI